MPKMEFTTMVGRMVQGDWFKPRTTDQQGNPRLVKSGPNAGQPSPQWYGALAFPKGSLEERDILSKIHKVAYESWPHLFPGGPGTKPTVQFSDKTIDGDGYDTTGKPWNSREGFAGHTVVKFSSGFPPKVYRPSGNTWVEVTNPAEAKCGYLYRVNGTIDTNNNPAKPGLYVNLVQVELVAIAPEIFSGPDAAGAFGGAPVGALPAYATALPASGGPTTPPPAAPPAAPATALTRVMTTQAQYTYEQYRAGGWTDEQLVANGLMLSPPAAPAAPPAAPAAPPAAPAAPPAAPAAPPAAPAAMGQYTGYMQAPAAPPAAPAAPPAAPAAPSGPGRMTPQAQYTYEQYRAGGWTDVQLIQQGLMHDYVPY